MDFVIIANQWDVHKDNPTSKHHVAMELVKKGHRVLWVVGSGMRTPSVGSGSDRGRIIRKLLGALEGARKQKTESRGQSGGQIVVIAPLIVPLPGNSLIRRIDEWIYLGSIRRASGKLGFEDPVLINFLPIIPGVLEKWGGKSIYYCVDKWSAFEEYDAELMDRLDAECCSNADMVIASARDLEERCRKHNENTQLILHGVDYDHFAKAASRSCLGGVLGRRRITFHVSRPSDMPEGRVVGFFGLLSAWVDQELIIKLARELNEPTPRCAYPSKGGDDVTSSSITNTQQLSTNVILIGKADVDVSRLEAEPNIYLLGQKDYADLPDYLAYFDVGLIPFVVNELTIAVNPIKLREMLAAGCAVVSTALPEVEQLQKTEGRGQRPENGVWVAGDASSFVEMVRGCLDNPMSDEEKKVLSESMAGETWRAKVDEILKRIQLIVGLMERMEQKVAKGAKRWWVCGGILLLLIVLMWPVGTWLQCRELQVENSDVDAVYLVAGSSHQDIRLQALTRYVLSITDVGNIKFLVGRDILNSSWSREKQRNLTRAEWAVEKIRDMCAGKGEISLEVVPGDFTGTDGEMEALATYLAEHQELKDVVIVTSAFHLRRTVWRLKSHLDVDVELKTLPADSRWEDRSPWTVLLEFAKMTRDSLGLSRVPLLSRGPPKH